MILVIYLSMLAQDSFDPVAEGVMYSRETLAVDCLYELVREAPSSQIETILADRSDQCRQQELDGLQEFLGNFHRAEADLGVMQTRRWFPRVMQKWREAHPFAG